MEKLRLIKCWKTLLLLLSMGMISGTIFAQDITLRGHVTDQKGEALIGATVKVNGTTNGGTVTDISGNFSLRAGANTTSLNVSYVGYVALNVPVKPGTTNLGNIVLANDANNLNEVVVVGYGTLKRQDVTGTVATVDHKSLQEIPSTNVFEQLKGKVAGVDVTTGSNGSPNILIRGARTIGNPGADGPLIILDGVPFRNNIENINPNDIKTLDVLKGASATAIYGSRGSGGVILITTNRGRIGQTQTSYDAYYGINKLADQLQMLDATGYQQLKKDVLQGAVLQGLQGTTDPNGLTAVEIANIAKGVNTDWGKLVIKNGFTTDHSLRVSGGTDKVQFNVGMGYNLGTALEPGNQTQRITLNTSVDAKLNNILKVGASIQNTLRIIQADGGSQYGAAKTYSPLFSPYNADGTLNVTPFVGTQDASAANPLLRASLPNAYYNHTRGFVTNDVVYAELSPIEHLKYRYQVGYSYSQSLQGQYNGINGADILTIVKTNASTTNNSQYATTQEHLLTYDNNFGKHHLNFVGGFTVETVHVENSNMSATGIPSDANKNSNLNLGTFQGFGGNISETGLISYLSRLNYAFSNKYDVTATYRIDGNSTLAAGHQYTSYPSLGLGWVISNEAFMQKYTFVDNLKLRAGYGENSTISGNPYQTLGQLNTSNFQYGGQTTGDSQGVRVTNLVNTNLTWQRTKEFNLALDFSVLKGRLSGSIEGYAQNTSGIILNNILPPTTGAGNQNSNLGNSSNRGIELTLSSINVRGNHGLSWSSDFNIGFARERIDRLPNDAPFNIGSGLWVGQPLSVIYDLRKVGIWQISDSPGIDATKTTAAGGVANGQAVYLPIAGVSPAAYPGQIRVQDLNGDGKIDANDNQIIGHNNPNYTFGFTNRFTYRNFDLSIVIQGRMGFTTVVPYVSSSNTGAQGWQFLNTGRKNQPVIPYWTPSNPGGTFPEPNFTQGNYYSTLQYYDGSFIRAKSINLGYNIPSAVLKHIGIASLRLYANMTNPFFIYAPVRNFGFTVPDAESTGLNGNQINAFSASGSNPRPVGINATTQVRTIIFGLNARF